MDPTDKKMFLGCEVLFDLKNGDEVRGIITDLKIARSAEGNSSSIEGDGVDPCSVTLSKVSVNALSIADPIEILATQIENLRVLKNGQTQDQKSQSKPPPVDRENCISTSSDKLGQKQSSGKAYRRKNPNNDWSKSNNVQGKQNNSNKQGRDRSRSLSGSIARSGSGSGSRHSYPKTRARSTARSESVPDPDVDIFALKEKGNKFRNEEETVPEHSEVEPEPLICLETGTGKPEQQKERNLETPTMGQARNVSCLLDALDDVEGIELTPPQYRNRMIPPLLPQKFPAPVQVQASSNSEFAGRTWTSSRASNSGISGNAKEVGISAAFHNSTRPINVYKASAKELLYYRDKNLCVMTTPSETLELNAKDWNYRDKKCRNSNAIYCGRFHVERSDNAVTNPRSNPIKAMLPEEKTEVFESLATKVGPKFWIRTSETVGHAVSQIIMSNVHRRNAGSGGSLRVLVVAGNNFQGAVSIVTARYLSLHKFEVFLFCDRGSEKSFEGTDEEILEHEFLHVIKHYNDLPHNLQFNVMVFGLDDYLSPTTTLHLYKQWMRLATVVLIEPPLISKPYKTLIDKIRGGGNNGGDNAFSPVFIIYAVRPSPCILEEGSKIFLSNVATVPKYGFIGHFSFTQLKQNSPPSSGNPNNHNHSYNYHYKN